MEANEELVDLECRKAQRKEALAKKSLFQCFDAKIADNWYALESGVSDKDLGLQP